MRPSTLYTCAIRKISTGHALGAFSGESLDFLRGVAAVIMQSPNYCRCYVVCTDWQGEVCFTLQPQGQAVAEPGAGMPMSQAQVRPQLGGYPVAPAPRPPSWDEYGARVLTERASTSASAYRAPAPRQIVDAEFEEELRGLPALPAFQR